MDEHKNQKTEKKEESQPMPMVKVWALAGELGLLIVIPLLILLFIGIWLDRLAGTKPLFIIVGLALSFITSTVVIARKIQEIQKGD